MKTKWMLGVLGACSGALVLATSLAADVRPGIVTSLTGTMRILQPIPCGGLVDRTTTVTGGRIELTPAEGVNSAGGAKRFALTLANVQFAPFSASGSCLLIEETRNYGPISVQLIRGAAFVASPTATPDEYAATIPRDSLIFAYQTTVNGDLETGYKFPQSDPTATINLATGAVTMHVVLGTRAHFEAGCTIFGCIIDETHNGTITADIAGTILFPDTDGDGVPDRSDNCRFVANADQTPVPTPTITAPANVTLASCLSRNFGVAKSADVCDGTPVVVTSNAPLQFALGPNTVLWRAEDGLNRVATANQIVTIVDTTAPTFTAVPPDVHLNDCGPANLGTPTATDDCAGTVTFTNNGLPKYYVGTTPVTWTAHDVSGNQSTAIQNVIVVDTVPPTVFCTPTNPTGTSFRVSAIDSCTGSPVIRLGSYVLTEGEVILINETGQPGIRLQNVVGADGIRHFQVGRGEAIITATDESNNVGSVTCSVPR